MRFEAFQREERWLRDLAAEAEELSTSLDEQAGAAEASSERLAVAPAGGLKADWLQEVAERARKRFVEVTKGLRELVQGVRAVAAEVEQEKAERWQPDFERARRDYQALRKELTERGVDFSQHEKLLQQRAVLEREIKNLDGIDRELEKVDKQIRDAWSNLVAAHEARLQMRRERARALEEVDADVRIEVFPFRDRADFESRREEWFGGAGVQERDWTLLCEHLYAPAGSVPERIQGLVEALREDIESTRSRGKALEPGESDVARLLGNDVGSSLTRFFFRALERDDRIRLDEMERFLPEDAVEARVRGSDGAFKPIATGSVGERSTAMLSLLLSAGEQPLIVDQPEDDLDNQYVYSVVVNLLRRRKFSRQILIATHNANIPVNGDAELIVALGVKNRLGVVLQAGSIDREQVKDEVSLIMEGSAEAFRLRRERYGF